MKLSKTWVWVGIGLLFWLVAGWGASQDATITTMQTQALAELRFWIWLPGWIHSWPILALVLGSVFLLVSVLQAWFSRITAATSPTRSISAYISAFSKDPWVASSPSSALPDIALPPRERMTLWWSMARDLEARGRLRAAREMYRQAYEIACHVPEGGEWRNEIFLAERKVSRRLALARVSRRIWPWS